MNTSAWITRTTQGAQARRVRMGWLLPALLLVLGGLWLATPQTVYAQDRVYVDKDATAGANDGTSWANAYTTLQAALDVTNANGATDYELWVAEGAYYPDEGGGRSDNDRTQYFRIIRDNVHIYGGFAGNETLREERNWAAHPVILSGDIDGDGTLSGNSFHVFYLNGRADNGGEPITNATTLDGVTITGGNADRDYGNEMYGGGIFCDAYGTNNRCSPALVNVIISGNYAESGGGVYNNGFMSGVSSPLLTNVIISGNRADRGGGMTNNGFSGGTSSPSLTNVTISGNHATQYGGGMFNQGTDGTSSPALVNSIVWGNKAGSSEMQVAGTGCTWERSIIGPGAAVASNLNTDPAFVDATSGDFHVTSGSPAVDHGDETMAPETDIDGDPRPSGTAPDLGADEVAQ